MKINESSIPSWVLEIISLDNLYQQLKTEQTLHEIIVKHESDKYKLRFENIENDTWNFNKIYKRNPQGFWCRINEYE